MIRYMTRSAALLLSGALLASGAWGQNSILRQSVEKKIAIASEYFGSPDGREVGQDVVGTDAGPEVVLTLADDPSDGDGQPSVDSGNVVRITYELTGATFAGTVSSSVLTTNVTGSTTEVVSGGAEGDSSVTIELTLGGPASDGATFTFDVPMLQVTPAVLHSDPDSGRTLAMGVGVSTSIATRKAVGTPFSSSIQDETDVLDEDGNALPADKNLADPVLVGSSQVYDTMAPALAFNWAGVRTNKALVDVGARKDIIRVGAKAFDPTAKSAATATPGLLVGTINITSTTAPPKDLGGRDGAVITTDGDDTLTADKYEVGQKLSGTANVTVTGVFQSGDKVYLGAKALTVSGGVAMGSMGIEGLLQSKGMEVIYVPGGVADLKPSTFVAVAKLDFDDDMNASPTAGPRPPANPAMASVGMIEYDGYGSQGYAYGVVKGGGVDSSHVRIGCASPSGCKVFLDCTDQSGMGYFGELDAIGGNATTVASSDAIAAALGGGWSSGRGSCSLLSNAKLEVQHMVRAGHVLVNNSVVVNKAVAPHSAINLICAYGVDLNGDGDTTDNDTTTGNINEATAYACKG